ncbi:MAG: MaoC family dehydratase [Alphaproteobacteria bacterium]|nr:MaoC family dehydratase [Alphaproteobacteria bacterium]
MSSLYYEDFDEGQVIDLGSYHVSADEIIAYASEFDPQDFHLSEEAGKSSVLGGLAASGWHVCAILVRMLTDAYIGKSAAMGSNGMDEVKWLKPVYAGETLTGRMTLLSKRVSSKRPEMGILKCRWELFNTDGEQKTDMVGVSFMQVRQP